MLQRIQNRQNRQNYHPCRFFHLTFKGHFKFATPDPFLRLFHCYEIGEGGQPHTHVGIDFGKKFISKPDLLKWIKTWLSLNTDPLFPLELRVQEPQIDCHPSWNSIYGYHHGLGDKPPCDPSPVWVSDEEPLHLHVRNLLRLSKKTDSSSVIASVNKLLLTTDLNILVDEGSIRLQDLKKYHDAKQIYNSVKSSVWLNIKWFPQDVKQRHIWCFDVPSTGKTAMCRSLLLSPGAFFKNLVEPLYWSDYRGQQFIIFNDFAGSIPVHSIKNLTDGLGTVAVKGGHVKLNNDPIFIVTSNLHPDDLWELHFAKNPLDKTAIHHRFIVCDSRGMYYLLHTKFKLIPHFPQDSNCDCFDN